MCVGERGGGGGEENQGKKRKNWKQMVHELNYDAQLSMPQMVYSSGLILLCLGLNGVFSGCPYEVKASKFLSFSALDASLLLNRASQRQKIAQPSVFKSLRLAGLGGLSWGG